MQHLGGNEHFGRSLELPFPQPHSPALPQPRVRPRELSLIRLLLKAHSSFLRITIVVRGGHETPRRPQDTYLKTQPWAQVTGARQETQKGKGTPALPCPAQEQVRSLSLHLFFLKPWVPDLPSRGDSAGRAPAGGAAKSRRRCPASPSMAISPRSPNCRHIMGGGLSFARCPFVGTHEGAAACKKASAAPTATGGARASGAERSNRRSTGFTCRSAAPR